MARWLVGLLFSLSLILGATQAMAATPPGLTCPPGGKVIPGTLNISTTPNDGVQTGRFTRAGNPASTCAAPHVAPSTQDAAANFGFDKYTFTNRSAAAQCITVTLQATGAGASGELQSAAYSGSASTGGGFIRTAITTNYLGDCGPGPATTTATYSFTVPALTDFEVVVSESNDGQGGNYTLTVSGCGQIAISTINPAFGHSSGGTPVTITGSGFALPGGAAPTVTFGGTPAVVSAGFSDTSLTVTAPAHAAGAVAVTVQQNPGGATDTVNPGFTYYDDITTTTTLTSAPNPSVFGQPVTLTANVLLTSANPGLSAPGNVEFFDGLTSLGSAAVNASGVATLIVSNFGVASHNLTATYTQAPAVPAGNATGSLVYVTSTSTPAVVQVVAKSGSVTQVSSSSNPLAIGGSVTFTASVTALAPGAGIPSGTATFSSDGVAFATGIALNANGQATATTNALPLGTHVITVSYSGDTSFVASVGTLAPAQTVSATATGITLVASPASPSTFGQSVTFTVTLTSTTGGTPTGTVIFRDGPDPTSPQICATQSVSAGGTAAITLATLAQGQHTIRADYSGDANHQAVAATITYQVNAAATSTTLTSSVNPSAPAQAVTFTATVTSTVAGTITGTVTFKDGASTLGTGTVGVGGAATFTTAALAVGSHNITAVYGGAGNFAPSTSAILVQVVRILVGDAGPDAAEAGKDGSLPDAAQADTGPGNDSGPPVDSGKPRVDSSTDDASDSVTGVLGGGGCDCSMTATPASSALSVLMWAGVGILVARRRKRSNKR